MTRIRIRCALALVLLAAPAGAADLSVVVEGAPSGGMVRAMVFADKDSFADQSHPLAALALTPRNGRVRVTIADVLPGRYAVAVFQDVNGNQQLDRNWLGVPTEPYGFSHEARPGLAAVTFDDAAVDLPPEGATVVVRLQ